MVKLLNFVLYQTGWFACVSGAAYSRPWLGVALALILIGIHLYLATDRLNQTKILLVAIGVGLVVDCLLLGVGVIQFPGGIIVAWLPPLWMSVLWMQFVTTFRYCVIWLSGRYAISGVLALFGAPLAFLGGDRVGAVSILPPPLPHLALLGIVWSIAIPVLVYASDRIHSQSKIAASYRGFDRPTAI